MQTCNSRHFYRTCHSGQSTQFNQRIDRHVCAGVTVFYIQVAKSSKAKQKLDWDPSARYRCALLVWSIGLSLGGTTGYAINPARDLGPRFMHFLLPMKIKKGVIGDMPGSRY
ncbi:MAG: hypothetical protein WDM78_11055 [Puia sp.]